MTAQPDDVARVLALVSNQPAEVVADQPMPPIGSSEAATSLWYALLGDYDFSIGEMVILEQLVIARTQLDEIESDWRRDGSPTQATGSMGQPVTDPRIQEMRQIRAQVASLVKSLNLPTDGGQARRPGRPTRQEAAARGQVSRWGTGVR